MNKLSILCFIVSGVCLTAGLLYLLPDHNPEWLFIGSVGVFFASLGLLFATYAYSPYSREKRKLKTNRLFVQWVVTGLSVILVSLALASCSTKFSSSDKVVEKITVVFEHEYNDNRPLYTVMIGDTVHTHLYAEEIAIGLLTNSWLSNEDATIINQ